MDSENCKCATQNTFPPLGELTSPPDFLAGFEGRAPEKGEGEDSEGQEGKGGRR